MKEKNIVQKQITKAVASDSVVKMYDILMKDITNMTKNQRRKHEITCKFKEV